MCMLGVTMAQMYQILVTNQLNFLHFFIRNADSDKINGNYVVGDPMTQLKLIKYF